MSKYILKINDLTKSFTSDKDKSPLLFDSLTIEFPAGAVIGLMGTNGAGKTTLFNIISRLVDCDKGNIWYDNGDKQIDLLKLKANVLKGIGIGRLFQDNHIFADMTILDNLLIGGEDSFGETPFITLFKRKKHKEKEKIRVAKAKMILTELFGKDNYFWQNRNNYASELSYGQQRLLGIARLLMSDHKLLLLDEPTAGVHPEIREMICEVIRKINTSKGVSIIIIEHNFKVIEVTADECCFIDQGEIAAVGPPEDIIGNPIVRKKYIGI
ncbi:ATP-binding cassette domain-containing protein [bacterium]|nr:ATP-binding cassette domain-containing protein [bacterium]